MEAELNRSEKSCERLKQNLKDVRVKLEGKDLTIEELNGKIEGLKVDRNDMKVAINHVLSLILSECDIGKELTTMSATWIRSTIRNHHLELRCLK